MEVLLLIGFGEGCSNTMRLPRDVYFAWWKGSVKKVRSEVEVRGMYRIGAKRDNCEVSTAMNIIYKTVRIMQQSLFGASRLFSNNNKHKGAQSVIREGESSTTPGHGLR